MTGLRSVIRQDTITARLLLLSIATACPLLVLLAFELAGHLRAARTAAAESSLRSAQSIAARIGEERARIVTLLAALARRPAMASLGEGGCDPIFPGFTTIRPELANLALIDTAGRLRCSAVPASSVSFAAQPWFRRAQTSPVGFVTGPAMSPILREWVVFHVQPLREPGGAFRGALVVPVRARRYAGVLSGSALGPQTVSTIHDGTGAIIARSVAHDQWVGQSAANVSIVREALAGRTGTVRGQGVDGKERIYGVVPLPDHSWWIEVGIPAATVFAPIRQWALGRAAIAVALLALAIALGVAVARSIAGPVRTLAERARQLSLGGGTELGAVEGLMEIRQLGASVEELLQHRARAETDLAARERRYQTILDTTTDGIWASGPDGLTTYVNPRMARMLGRPPEEIVGRPASEMFDEDLRAGMEARLEQRKQGIPGSYELHLRGTQAGARWQVQSTPVLDPSGAYQGLVATISDVTREREAEERAREKEQQLETIFASAMDGIVIIDESHRVLMFNEAAEAMFGYAREEVIGRSVEELMPQRFRATHAAHVREFSEKNVSRRAMGNLGSVFGVRKNGGEFPIEASISHVRAGDRILCSVILRDATARLEAERALRESESRLSTVIALSGAGVWEGDTSSDALFCDERCAQILGFEPGTSMPVPYAATLAQIHPDEQERMGIDFSLLRSGETDQFDAEYRLVTRGGGTISVASVGRVVERLEGGHMRILGATFDITARKEAERRLSEEMEFNRTLIDASPAFFVAFGRDGTILSVNEAFLSATGYVRDEVVGREYIGMFIPPEAQQEARSARETISTQDATVALEAPVLTRDGTRLIVEWHARPVLSGDGELQFNFGVGIDVTQRKAQETELRSHVGVLAALHETTLDLLRHRPLPETMEAIVRRAAELFDCPDALLAMHQPGANVLRVIAGVGAAHQLIGQEMGPGESMIGVVYGSGEPLVVDDYQAWPQARFTDRLPSRAMAGVPMKIDDKVVGTLAMGYRAAGRRFTAQQVEVMTRFAQLAAVVVEQARLMADARREIADRLRAEDEILRLNATLEETVRARTSELQSQIGERVRVEAELRRRTEQLSNANLDLAAAAKLKDEFLANMSHELRTPLNAILGMSEILEDGVHGPVNERQLRSVRVIVESGEHLLELINDILDLAKIESGTVDLAIEPINVHSACEASLRMLREAAQRKSIRLSLDLEPGIETADVDGRRLRQILVNLLSNAVKFTPDGGAVTLRVRGEESANTIRFAVEDNGIGIPQAEIERLFQPFVQLDSGSTRQYGGTGLGLSLVRRMAEMHGGRVAVESVVGKGSTFTLFLPWRVALAAPAANGHSAQGVGGSGPVLVIEDDAAAALIISRYLTEAGLPAAVWDGQEELLPLIEQMRPRLVVLDILLETTTGWAVLAGIKRSPAIASTPVLVISVIDDSARGLAMGAVHYLVKPIRQDQLQAALVRIFPELRQQIENRGRGSLILLAEDNEANIEVIESYLTGRGFRVIVARDGVAAVELALDREPALILMDIQMPKMNGLDATMRIRESGKRGRQVPILALTAMAMAGDVERCIAAGANECLTKPVSLKVLDETMRRYLDARSPERPA